jgi:AraC-like DNA-binding protein
MSDCLLRLACAGLAFVAAIAPAAAQNYPEPRRPVTIIVPYAPGGGTLAAKAGVSQRSLSRLFRAGLDVIPADFVERVRTDLARRKLLETDEQVETIAVACGFGSLRRMDRAFARTIAASPSAFRARFKTGDSRA